MPICIHVLLPFQTIPMPFHALNSAKVLVHAIHFYLAEDEKSISGYFILFKRVRSKLTVEWGKMAVKPLRSARTLKNGKDNEPKLILELGFLHNGTELMGNFCRRTLVRSTRKRTQDECIFAMLNAHAEDGTNLVEHYLLALGCEATVFGTVRHLVGVGVIHSAVEAEPCNRNNIALEMLVSESVVFRDVVSEEGNAGRVNAAVVDVVRIADFSYGDTAISYVLVLGIAELIQRLAEC